ELQKLTGRVASGQWDDSKRTKEEETDDEVCFDSLLWGPEDLPLLCRWFEPTADMQDRKK
ncbi:hypothetical protein GOODEAATRI_020158, partial [Goodea atripinnis]